jgi:hypothetical protein
MFSSFLGLDRHGFARDYITVLFLRGYTLIKNYPASLFLFFLCPASFYYGD